MKRLILLYGLAVAGVTFLLRWLEYRHAVRTFSTEIYGVSIALLFAGLGVWVGLRLAGPKRSEAFEPNERARASLGISKREFEVLELLAQGLTNQQIAERLFVSGNTVKSHLGRLYQKLEVSRRTQAVQKARSLHLIP